MRTKSPLLFLTVVLATAVVPAHAAKKKPAAKPVASNQAAKKKTVGELLKQADRGAGATMVKKQGTALPAFGKSLFEQSQGGQSSQVNLGEVKPPRTSPILQDQGDDKAQLEAIVDKQIREIYKLTQKFKNSPNRGELWLRMAELYVEKSAYVDFRHQNEYDQRLKDYQSGKTKIKPNLDNREALEYNRKAIQLYEWFVRDFPKDSKMDQALYFLGYNYYELGETKKGTAYYTRLTKEYPQSPFIIESNFALAEYYFENEKWNQAREYYQQVAKYRRHRLYAFSQYKIAWCFFRSGDSKKALITMETLIREGREGGASEREKRQAGRAKLELEGLRDIVLFYADVGDYKAAPGYFANLTGTDGFSYTEKLAYLYADKGNRDGARYLFNYMIAEKPAAEKAFDYKYQIVKVYSNANKTREFREELYAWIRDFGTESPWGQANKKKPELIQNSEKLREQTLRTWVLQQHQTAQNSRAPFSQALAFEGYKLYITEFPKHPMAADIHFYYGELLYDMNRFDEAATNYRWVVDNAPNSKFYGKASENTVLSLEKNVPKDDEIVKRVGKSLDPVALEPRVEKFVQNGIWYTNKFPQGERTPEVRFRVGRLYYQHNQFDQAIPYFKDIIQKYPKTKYAEYSANLLLDIFNLKKDYASLEKTGNELLAIPSIASSDAGKDIKNVIEQASFKRGQDLEGQKEYGKAAESFEGFAKGHPHSELAGTAMFNAAINYERAGQSGKALQAHQAVLRSNDKKVENLKPKSRAIVAKLYQDTGQLEEASKAYAAAAQENPKDPLAPNWLFNAAVLNEALGKSTQATRDYEQFAEKSKKASDRKDAYFSIATLQRKAGKNSTAEKKYEEFLDAGGTTNEKNVESSYWAFRLNQKMGRADKADSWRKRTLAMQARYAPNKKGVGAKYAAEIKLEEAEETYKEFRRINLNNVRKLKENMDMKLSILGKLNNQLGEIIKYDSPDEIVGALSLLGHANLNMAESIVNSPVPAELKKADEISGYKAGIQKLADPFYAKAKESLKTAVDRGLEFEAYGPEFHKARASLARLDKDAVYDGGEEGFEVRQPNWMGL